VADRVDVVINTHVHSDHVGWNTKRDGDSWVPTFPNARYLIPEADYRLFHPDNAKAAAVTRKRMLTEATRRRAVVTPRTTRATEG
jgi:glyoxylase-like metal-dependent hydrolase (beta-lactamase superfamily II)